MSNIELSKILEQKFLQAIAFSLQVILQSKGFCNSFKITV